MENFTPVSRELTNSSLWRSLAGTEAKILIDLLALAPFKATPYNLYGVDIQLEKHELCFSCVKMAEKYKVTDYFIRSLLKKLEGDGIIKKTTRKISRGNSKGNSKGSSQGKFVNEKICSFTSIIFYSWVFACKEKFDQASVEKCQNQKPFLEGSQKGNRRHNKELIKEEEKKEEKEKKQTTCACARADFFSSPPGNDKIWYPVDQIANLDFPYAEDILETWREFSGQTNIQIKPLLHKYCNEQKMININQMTLDVFDFRFRKYMNRVFKTKSKKVEPVRVPNYIRFDD